MISPDEMNRHLETVMIAPMTTKSRAYPTRVKMDFMGKTSWVVLDQIRTVDRQRFLKKLGELDEDTIARVKETIKVMLVE